MSSGHRRTRTIIGEALLWPVAVGGVLCVVLAVLGTALGFRIILFSSGSMSPTVPSGAAALVQTVPASDIHTGDVVTVDRGTKMPVTHRVIQVGAPSPANPTSSTRLLTLQGDANDSPDPSPYQVDTVGRLVFSVPGLASTVAQLGNPRLLAPLGLAAAGFVIWGLWPTRRSAPGPN